jgi:hypothetical protein
MRSYIVMGCIMAATVSVGVQAADSVPPYPQALDAATVTQDRLDDVGRNALVLGNGDLNALLFSRGHTLRMRVTKNDIWDARIDTSRDPDLLRMDLRKRTWTCRSQRSSTRRAATTGNGRALPAATRPAATAAGRGSPTTSATW